MFMFLGIHIRFIAKIAREAGAGHFIYDGGYLEYTLASFAKKWFSLLVFSLCNNAVTNCPYL